MMKTKARIIGISRHRLSTDGEGVTTLVAFHGCPLRCRYCLNPQSFGSSLRFKEYTPQSLYDEVKVDDLYFLATSGGVTFGGGEPALRTDFIVAFRALCGEAWRLTLETSLNVPADNVAALIPVVDSWYIDIKDMNSEIYRKYTGRDNANVLENLQQIADASRQSDCIIRMPLMPVFNTDADREISRTKLLSLGYSNFDLFTYQIKGIDLCQEENRHAGY